MDREAMKMKDLIKKHNIPMDIVSIYRLLRYNGYIERYKEPVLGRKVVKGVAKRLERETTYIPTELGIKYCVSQTRKKSDKVIGILFYEDTFLELMELIGVKNG